MMSNKISSLADRINVFKLFIFTLFFVSGFCALTLQNIWNRVLGQIIGIDFFSNVIIVSIFMLGLGLGGYLGGIITKYVRNSIWLFPIAEIIIAIYAYFSDSILRKAQLIQPQIFLADLSLQGYLIDFGLYFLILLWPVILMGISLPLVVHVVRHRFPPGEAVGRLYTLNIAGATLGCAVSGILLTGWFGLAATLRLVAIINLIIAVAVLAGLGWLSTKRSPAGNNHIFKEKDRQINLTYSPKRYYLLLFSFIIGFIAIGYEIMYFRIFVYYFGSTSYVFPIVLSCYLLMLGVGTAVASYLFKINFDKHSLLQIALIGSVITSAIIFLLPMLIELCGFTCPRLTAITTHKTIDRFIIALGIVPVGLLPVAFLSLLFPLIVHQITNDPKFLGVNVGQVYLTQTLGNFVGSLVTGILFLPVFGTLNTARFFVIILTLLAIAGNSPGILGQNGREIFPWRKGKWVGLALISMIITLMPMRSSFYQHFIYLGKGPQRVIEQYEGSAFIYDSRDGKRSYIKIGAEKAMGYVRADSNYFLWPTDVTLAALGREPKRMLLIGCGGAYYATVLHKIYPKVEIVIVELLDVVINEMRHYGSPDTKDLLSAAHIYITDGSRYVNKVAFGDFKPFDLIQIGIFHSTSSGAGNLFAKEFLQKCKSILTKDGVIFLNAYAPAVKAGLNLFNSVIIAGRPPFADVFMTDRQFGKGNDFIYSYLKERQEILAQMAPERDKSFIFNPPASAFFIISKKKLKDILRNIPLQTFNLPVTEHFLTNDINLVILPGKSPDCRYWPPQAADVTIKSLMAKYPQLFPGLLPNAIASEDMAERN